MIELPFIFFSGLLGASHCIGMCGPFALVIGAASDSTKENVLRQILYGFGRIFTYCFLGATAGFVGQRFTTLGGPLVNASAVLAVVAGTFLIYQGLATAGVIRRRIGFKGSETGCTAAPIFRTFLTSRRRGHMFLAGLVTGFLPCGLLYGMLALAAGTGSLVSGLSVMSVFGLGTLPLMTATGVGGSLVSLAARKKLLAVAAWSVVMAGVITVGRGVNQWGATSVAEAAAACPMCRD